MTEPLEPSSSDVRYRMRPEEVWADARDAYRNGFTAQEVCERYDLGVSAFWKRARSEKWRRSDMDYEYPGDDILDEDEPVASRGDLADLAWARATRSLRAGRYAEAQRLLRIHADLTRPDKPPPREPDPFAGLTRRIDAIGHVAQTLGMDPDAFHAADRAVREHRAGGSKVQKVQSLSDTALSDDPDDPDPPLNRADRRRLARERRGKAPP
ncbi:hypothetical protein BH10PSE1_BH10PSE1_23210 [soil metagenome]